MDRSDRRRWVGQWWLPSAPEHVLPGILEQDETNHFLLTIVGVEGGPDVDYASAAVKTESRTLDTSSDLGGVAVQAPGISRRTDVENRNAFKEPTESGRLLPPALTDHSVPMILGHTDSDDGDYARVLQLARRSCLARRQLWSMRRLRPALNIFFGQAYIPSGYLEEMVVAVAVVAEALHRELYTGTADVSSKNDFEAILAKIKCATTSDDRAFLRDHMFTETFEERMTELTLVPDQKALKLAIPDRAAWSYDLKHRRNAMSHGLADPHQRLGLDNDPHLPVRYLVVQTTLLIRLVWLHDLASQESGRSVMCPATASSSCCANRWSTSARVHRRRPRPDLPINAERLVSRPRPARSRSTRDRSAFFVGNVGDARASARPRSDRLPTLASEAC